MPEAPLEALPFSHEQAHHGSMKYVTPIAVMALLVGLALFIPADYYRENAIAVSIGSCLFWIGQRMRHHGA
jgi:hypothetical protein